MASATGTRRTQPTRPAGAFQAPAERRKTMGGFGLQWHITDRCDQRCAHCYIFNSTDRVGGVTEFSLPDAKDVVDGFVSFCSAVGKSPSITITGGDPLLHPSIWEILSYLKESGIRFTILGNPFHLNREVAARLYSLGCRNYQMSLDGLRETHDSIRKPGSFDATVSKICDLKDAGIRANIMSTVSALNYRDIPDLVRLIVSEGVDLHAFARYCPTHNDLEYSLDPKEYREFLASMWSIYTELADSGTTFTLKDHLWTPFLYEIGEFSPIETNLVYAGCACGISHITLLEDGSVYACRRFNSPIGNINDQDFASLFWGEEMSRYREVDKIEGCKDCALLNCCRGCRAVAAGYTGDYFQRDPQCWR